MDKNKYRILLQSHNLLYSAKEQSLRDTGSLVHISVEKKMALLRAKSSKVYV